LIFLFLTGISFVVFMTNKNSQNLLKIGSIDLLVEIASSPKEYSKGLSNREVLKNGHGMLFVFDDKKIRNFWMKDMNFDLDVVWILENKVIGFQENVPIFSKDGQVTRFSSNVPCDMVLEVKSGWVSENGIKIGDIVDFF